MVRGLLPARRAPAPDHPAEALDDEALAVEIGFDGLINQIEPGLPLDTDAYHRPPELAARLAGGGPGRPGGRSHVPAAGRCLHPDVIETWIDDKRRREVDPVRLRPHPYEFYLTVRCLTGLLGEMPKLGAANFGQSARGRARSVSISIEAERGAGAHRRCGLCRLSQSADGLGAFSGRATPARGGGHSDHRT